MPTEKFVSPWLDKVQLWVKTRGALDTCKRIKAIRLHVTRYISGTPLKEAAHPSLSINKRGLPRNLGNLQELVDGSVSEQRLLMTLLLVSRVIPVIGKPDLSPITAPFNGTDLTALKKDVAWVISDLGLKIDRPVWSEPHLTTRRSPNGQALVASMYELTILPASLQRDLGILGGQELSAYIEGLREFPLEAWMAKLPVKPNGLIRKLSTINDPEGKCRIIGLLDYWSQTALKPLHDEIFSLLRGFRGDATFNQKGWDRWLASTGPYYSLDLSNATDRFPAEMQRFILEQAIDPEYAGAWVRVLTDHEFKVPWEGHSVKYAVGQPIGAYSSWAVFALSHHLMVRVAATRAGLGPRWHGYVLLGDDIVIGNHDVAKHYREIMDNLGVQISEAKSHVSEDTFEFAKRWVRSGQEITGAPIKGMLDSTRFYEVVNHISEIEDRWLLDDTMVTRQMLSGLFAIFTYRSLSRRLARKAYNLFLMPRASDGPNVAQEKLIRVCREWFDNILGCFNEGKPFAREVWYEWVAEAKTAVLEAGIKKSHKNLVLFQQKVQELFATSRDTGSVSPELMKALPPVIVAQSNLGNMQQEFDQLREAFTTGREEDIVFNRVVRLGLAPDRLFTDRDHKLILATHASLSYNTKRLLDMYISERPKAFEDDTPSED